MDEIPSLGAVTNKAGLSVGPGTDKELACHATLTELQ